MLPSPSTLLPDSIIIDNRILVEFSLFNWLNFVKVYGPSMLPTLNLTGDVLLVDKLSPLLGKVGTGEVVMVRSPENPRKTITKRIVGVEGDTVTFLVDPGRSDRSTSVVVRMRYDLTIYNFDNNGCPYSFGCFD